MKISVFGYKDVEVKSADFCRATECRYIHSEEYLGVEYNVYGYVGGNVEKYFAVIASEFEENRCRK